MTTKKDYDIRRKLKVSMKNTKNLKILSFLDSLATQYLTKKTLSVKQIESLDKIYKFAKKPHTPRRINRR